MTNANLFTPTTVSVQFISNEVTKAMAQTVQAKYNKLYKNVHWSKAPVLETVCFHEAQNILNCVNLPKDAYKMNVGFLEAIKLMRFDFMEEFEVESWENMLLDLPLSEVDQLHTIDYLID